MQINEEKIIKDYNDWLTFYRNLYSYSNINDICKFVFECEDKESILRSLDKFSETHKTKKKQSFIKDILSKSNCLISEDDIDKNNINMTDIFFNADDNEFCFTFPTDNTKTLYFFYRVTNLEDILKKKFKEESQEKKEIENDKDIDLSISLSDVYESLEDETNEHKLLKYLQKDYIPTDIQDNENRKRYLEILESHIRMSLTTCIYSHAADKINKILELFPYAKLYDSLVIYEDFYEMCTDSLMIIRFTENISIFKYHYYRSLKIDKNETDIICLRHLTSLSTTKSITDFLLSLYYDKLDAYHKSLMIDRFYKRLSYSNVLKYILENDSHLFNIYDKGLSYKTMSIIYNDYNYLIEDSKKDDYLKRIRNNEDNEK